MDDTKEQTGTIDAPAYPVPSIPEVPDEKLAILLSGTDDVSAAPLPPWQFAFLKTLCETACVTTAALSAGISTQLAHTTRRADRRFAAAWSAALERYGDALHGAARSRAVQGWLEPVYFQGVQCGAKRKYSDGLLEQLLQAHGGPNFKRTLQHEVSGPGGGAIPVNVEHSIAKIYGSVPAPIDSGSKTVAVDVETEDTRQLPDAGATSTAPGTSE